MAKFIQIDEEGYFLSQGLRVSDEDYGKELLKNLFIDEIGGLYTKYANGEVIVEAFDAPLVAKQVVDLHGPLWTLLCPYGYKIQIDPSTLSVDEWDRFHCIGPSQLPVVFSRAAQAELFNRAESFTDESLDINGQRFLTYPHLATEIDTRPANFWSEKYLSAEKPGWELNAPSTPLQHGLPQLKLPRSRILVPGCGTGNDAAFLAEQGHIVTAFDYSEEAIKKAHEKYRHVKNLEFKVLDVFALPDDFKKSFDIIFEHTCFCAIPLDMRPKLVDVWRACLDDEGALLAVFFVMSNLKRPPFGGTEWEYRQRLQKHFQFLYWTRWQQDDSWRLGKELLVYAKLKTS